MLEDKSHFPRLPIGRLSKTMGQSVDRAFSKHGYPVTTEQEMVLRTLRSTGPISQTELANYTGQDRNNLSRTVGILEKKGLVRKENSQTDRRYCEISITPEGETVHERLWEILEEWRKQLFDGIEHRDLEYFTDVANKLIENIEKIKVNFNGN